MNFSYLQIISYYAKCCTFSTAAFILWHSRVPLWDPPISPCWSLSSMPCNRMWGQRPLCHPGKTELYELGCQIFTNISESCPPFSRVRPYWMTNPAPGRKRGLSWSSTACKADQVSGPRLGKLLPLSLSQCTSKQGTTAVCAWGQRQPEEGDQQTNNPNLLSTAKAVPLTWEVQTLRNHRKPPPLEHMRWSRAQQAVTQK